MPKTIFGTTEKSNFILNMKTEEYYTFNLRILILFLVLMPVFSLVQEFIKSYSVPGMALAITGVFSIVFMFIGFMKRVTPKHLWLPAGLLGAMVVWSCVSLYNSYYYNVSLLGADGRSEGVLSVLFYGCFFLLGAQLGTDANRRKLLNGMLWMGLAECIWGLLQALPIGLPSYYQDLEPMMMFRAFLPSGLTGSPIFLATLLVMLSFPALMGAVFAEEKKQRLFYTVCAVAFVLISVKTQCLIGICGMALSILSALVCFFCKKGGKCALLKTGAALLAFVIGIGWVWASPSLNDMSSSKLIEGTEISNGIILYDGGIIWKDASYRLEVSGYYSPTFAENPNGMFDINSLSETYSYLWKGTAKIAEEFPLVGSGPDNLVYPQLFYSLTVSNNMNTFDRAYNHYLHLAATMGFPMLALFVVLMVLTLIRGGKGCSGIWLRTGMLGAVVLYLVMMVIGSSCITVAPLFWMLAGCCAGMTKKDA